MTEVSSREAARLVLEIIPRLMHVVAATVKPEDTGYLSVTQFRLMKRLAQHPWTVSELAQAMRFSVPTVSVAVDSLVRRGLVTRGEASDDRRANPLTLTPEGSQLCETVQEHALDTLGTILEQLPAGGRAALAEGLGAVARALDNALASQADPRLSTDSNSKGSIS